MPHIKTSYKFAILIASIIAAIALAAWYISSHPLAVLAPMGQIGEAQRNLIIVGALLSIIVVVPVFVMTIVIAYRYRESNGRAAYQPTWDHSPLFETIWWGIPCAIILALSIITWQSSHTLDPSRAIASNESPLAIQVVSLDWKWLFIYPAQHVASVNEVALPVGRPVTFSLTSDSVMNSFWIPQLGGQLYAMPGMSTTLHLIADQSGTYFGSPANITGKGFSGMDFTAKALDASDFSQWLATAGRSPHKLDLSAYTALAKPSQDNPTTYYYSSVEDGLYNLIVMKYMLPDISRVTQ